MKRLLIVIVLLASVAAFGQVDASQLTKGTLPAARIPAPTSTTLGGVKGSSGSLTCGTGNVQQGFNSDGSIACVAAGGNSAFGSVTGGTNTATLAEGTGGSLTPASSGQVSGNQVWFAKGLLAPSISFSTTGGSFVTSRAISIRYAFNTAAGVTLASASTNGGNSTFGCSSGSTCSLTITAPALPSGYTGYSVYAQDCGGTPCSGSETLQPSCSNITANCVLTSVTAGSAIPTTASAFIQPSGVQPSECAPGIIPTLFTADQSGNYHTAAGVDLVSNNGQTSGTLEFCRRTWFTDQGKTPLPGNNAFIVFDHYSGVGTSTTNQDRTVWVNWSNVNTPTQNIYGAEGIQNELDFYCNGCAVTGSPDGEVTTFSGQLSNNAITGYSSPYGTNVNRASYFRNAAGMDTGGNFGYYAQMVNGTATSPPGGSQMFGFNSKCVNGAGQANLLCGGYRYVPDSTGYGNGQIGFYSTPVSLFTPGSRDYLIRNDVHAFNSIMDGIVSALGIANSDQGTTLPVTASVAVTGSVTVSPIANSWAGISGSCTGGSSGYTYQFVAVDGNGGTVASAVSNNMNTCTNPLTSGNPATVFYNQTITLNGVLSQAARIDVYRVSGPMATGKVGSLSCTANFVIQGCSSFVDTGLAASGSLPTGNTTGSSSAPLYSSSQGTLASATTIAPVNQLTSVTGTATISTITIPFTGFIGCLQLIPTGLWATTTGGNIALASTAVVSRVLIECYNGTSWYPSY